MDLILKMIQRYEGIAKTNTTHTDSISGGLGECLRVLLKQIQHTQNRYRNPKRVV